ncbi:MAG: class I SAM-dependent methyltransferase [Planctomycetia bacterium]|jgi:ubiquinone/menaquinone biosynthesis C-methylase UbiE
MIKLSPQRRQRRARRELPKRKVVNRIIESRLIEEVSFEKYRDKVRGVYDGPQGAILATCSFLSLHSPLGERLFRTRRFDLRGAKRILDVGSGAGQIAKHLVKYADPSSELVCFDLSHEMLRRARSRIKSDRPTYVVADLTRLPFEDNSFDCVTCGYVLEHLPNAQDGLRELARVMAPGGRILLLTTEDTFGGAWTSRFWHCRTYNRNELRKTCLDLGFDWQKEIWFTRLHKAVRAGGIGVELVKRGQRTEDR